MSVKKSELANFSKSVAEHYNNVEEKSNSERKKSQIYDLRKFNNGTKDYLITRALKLAGDSTRVDKTKKFKVLEMGCGKGGDLTKYSKKEFDFYFGADIADVSIKQAKARYNEISGGISNFKAAFVVSDLTRDNLEEKIRMFSSEHHPILSHSKTNPIFDIVSAQFCIHYSYESYEQAVRFIQNAHDNLKKLGFFIGTYPDGARLFKLARASKDNTYKVADLLSVKFDTDCKKPELFGTKYHFKLAEVVDCPEFVVHPSVMKKMFEAAGFHLVYDESFGEFVERNFKEEASKEVIKNTYKKFEAFNSIHINDVEDNKEYEHLRGKIFQHQEDSKTFVGTLPKSIWSIANVYRVFCYRKL